MLLAAALASVVNFELATDAFPASVKNLRQWESATVADLDQDGWPDLLLNDHGFSVRVMWNNRGKYAKPYDLIMGDMHGFAVGDYDQDGNMEIVLSRGGGSGSNARNSLIMQVDKQRTFTREPDFDVPLALMRGRTVKFSDLDLDGDLDLINFAFPSKEKRGESENYLYENISSNKHGNLVLAGELPKANGDGQKTLVTHINDDRIPDLIMYGHDIVRFYQGVDSNTNKNKQTTGFHYEEVTNTLIKQNFRDVTNVLSFDADNDGDQDLYLTRGKSFRAGDTFFDKQKLLLGFYNLRGQKAFNKFVAGDVVNLINFQSQWPHKSLYLGESGYEYQYPGETHSGRDVRLVNSDLLGFPEVIDKKGMFLGYVGNKQWQMVSNTWAPMSGVVSGVERFEASGAEAGLNNVLLINDKGKYKPFDAAFDQTLKNHSHAGAVLDIDNNGWQDIVVVNRGNLISENRADVYLNQGIIKGKLGFKLMNSHGIATHDLGSVGMGITAVDYNKDGAVDLVWGNERGRWHLFENKTPKNNFVKVEVAGSNTPHNAKVTIAGCGKTQTRFVAEYNAPYSQGLNNPLHFGVGQCDQQVDVKVSWSNGDSAKAKTKVNKQVTLKN